MLSPRFRFCDRINLSAIFYSQFPVDFKAASHHCELRSRTQVPSPERFARIGRYLHEDVAAA